MKLSLKLLSTGIILSTIVGCNEKKQDSKEPMKEETSKPETIELLVGTYTNETSEGIYKLAFNPIDGNIENMGLVAEVVSPSYLALSENKQFVYAVNENNPGKVSSFQWNDERTKLNPISNQDCSGKGPCYVEINNSENMLAIANYGSGNISMYKIENGIIQDSVQTRQHEGTGPVKPNQNGPHAHCVKFDSNGKIIYAVDLGIDQVLSYAIDNQGNLGEKQTALFLDKGDGPRHLIFHPTKDMAFVINELSNSITSAKVDPDTGIFEKIDKQSTLPKDYTEKSYCADIHISSNGKFIYGSNRGHNSIAVFSVSEEGKLNLIQTESVRGDWPRNFTLSPDGKFLLVANQNSDNIAVFAINQETGLLTYTGKEIKLSKPVCLKF